jgi:hypothetical protein
VPSKDSISRRVGASCRGDRDEQRLEEAWAKPLQQAFDGIADVKDAAGLIPAAGKEDLQEFLGNLAGRHFFPCRRRLRPIILTSFAFLLGVVPLMLSVGGAQGCGGRWAFFGVSRLFRLHHRRPAARVAAVDRSIRSHRCGRRLFLGRFDRFAVAFVERLAQLRDLAVALLLLRFLR